jgi:Caspase domain
MPIGRYAAYVVSFGCALVFASFAGPALCTHAAQNQEAPGRKLAFLVGVNQYRHAKLDKLDFAERDVEALAKVLGDQGYQVTLLTGTGAAIADIQARLRELLKTVGSKDLILVALAGHGLQPEGTSDA